MSWREKFEHFFPTTVLGFIGGGILAGAAVVKLMSEEGELIDALGFGLFGFALITVWFIPHFFKRSREVRNSRSRYIPPNPPPIG
ncbi:MAG: hypothetical protein ABSA70_17150 [Terriglobia bacterium]